MKATARSLGGYVLHELAMDLRFVYLFVSEIPFYLQERDSTRIY
jgi:hypothetical protein